MGTAVTPQPFLGNPHTGRIAQGNENVHAPRLAGRHPLRWIPEKCGSSCQAVILPRRNERDLEDVPAELREGMTFVFVDSAEEVLPQALESEAAKPALAAAGPTPLPSTDGGNERRSARAAARKRGEARDRE